MALLFILFITEILTLAVLRQHFYNVSITRYSISLIIHIILSLWTWIIFIELSSYNSFYDNPKHVWLLLNMTGMIVAIVIPRIIIILFHFSGKLIKRKTGGHLRWLTNTGLIMMIVVITIIMFRCPVWKI